MFLNILLLLFLIEFKGRSLAFAFDGLPGDICSTEGETCDMLDNIIKIYSGVFSNDECRPLCEDFYCKYFTYFSSGGFQFSETCVLFSSCGSLHTCEGCTTEALCHQLEVIREVCSTPIKGQVEENLISYIPNIENETSCKDPVFLTRTVFFTLIIFCLIPAFL